MTLHNRMTRIRPEELAEHEAAKPDVLEGTWDSIKKEKASERKAVVNEKVDLTRYSVHFPGSSADLLIDYPELRNVPAFTAVRENDPRKLVFVWWYAHKASPGMSFKSDIARIRFAIKKAFGDDPPKKIVDTFERRAWGPQVSAAIEAMRKYEPNIRIRMRLLAAAKFEEVSEMMNATSSKLSDADEKKKHFAMISEGMKVIGNLLPMMEVGANGVVELDPDKAEEQKNGPAEFLMRYRSTRQALD